MGIRRPVVAASMPVIRFGGEGKWRGGWGVKRGECGAVSGRGGDIGAVRVRASGGAGGCAVGCPRKNKLGGAHTTVREEGGGGLGRPEAKARWGGRLVAGLGRRRWPKRGGGGVGRWQITRVGRKGRRPGQNYCSG
jgi:hypothetical protein